MTPSRSKEFIRIPRAPWWSRAMFAFRLSRPMPLIALAILSAGSPALAQTGAEHVAKMMQLGLRHFRIEFLNEPPELVRQTIRQYQMLLSGEISGETLWRELKVMNQLGVTRGQMQKTT